MTQEVGLSLKRGRKIDPLSDFYFRKNPLKDEQRNKVRDFIQQNCESKYPRVLCLPGREWTWERTIRFETEGKGVGWMFVGFERDPNIYLQSLRYLPGNEKLWNAQFNTQYGYISAALRPGKFSTVSPCILVNADVIDFLELWPEPQSWSSPDRWDKTFARTTAIWLDSFSPICTPRTWTLFSNLHRTISPEVDTVPIALSFIVGRDDPKCRRAAELIMPEGSAMDRRAAFIKVVAQRMDGWACEIAGTHQYDSGSAEGTLTIGTVFAILRRKEFKR